MNENETTTTEPAPSLIEGKPQTVTVTRSGWVSIAPEKLAKIEARLARYTKRHDGLRKRISELQKKAKELYRLKRRARAKLQHSKVRQKIPYHVTMDGVNAPTINGKAADMANHLHSGIVHDALKQINPLAP